MRVSTPSLQAMTDDTAPDFSTLVRPFPTPALLTGAGDIEGLLPRLRRVRERVKAGRTPGVATGLETLDGHLGGLQTGVHLLAASPGAGKTTLALQIARRAAADGVSVLYLAFDEGGDRLALKLVATQGGLLFGRYLKGEADPDELLPVLDKHHDLLARIRIYNGPAGISPADTVAMLNEARGIDGSEEGLIIVDFVQSWAARLDSANDFRLAVTHLIGGLRQAALAAQVPILAIAAQNRSGQGEASLSSLRESSDLEYTADTITFLTTDGDDQADPRRRVTLSCRKNRFGATFDIPMVFDAERAVFRESTERQLVADTTTSRSSGRR
jgi:replicative DNA helicase